MELLESNEPVQSRKLFIGGLDYTTTDDSLQQYFEQWGEVVDAVVIKSHISKRSRGFGFVTYSQSSMVEYAMSNRPHTINGRLVETKRAVSRDDMSEPNIKAAVKKIFVFGIKKQLDDDILEYFEQFGNVVDINIVTDKDSGKRKGYGFIEYDDTDSVDKVIFIKSHQVAGRKLDVRKAISRIGVTGYNRGGHGSYGGGGFNRSSWIVNPRYEHWGGYHNRSNGWNGGYGNCEMRGGYGSVGGGGWYGGSVFVYNSNVGRAWQDVPQRWDYNNPALGNQKDGDWECSQQPNNNLGSNQSYGLDNSYYTSYNNYAIPYENSGAGYVNVQYAGNGQYPG